MENKEDFIRRNGRKLYPFECGHCGGVSYRRQDHIKNVKNKYCSLTCKNTAQITLVTVVCKQCGKSIKRLPSQLKRSKASFCNSSCAASLNNTIHKKGKKHPNYTDGSGSYRVKALREFEHKCHNPDCLLTLQLECIPVEMLDVDHVDNDRTNNKTSNLIILCVWCHTLKTRNVEVVDQ